MAVILNPSWPVVTVNGDFTQGPPRVPGVAAMSLNAGTRRNAVRQIGIQRGRQYELDQCQAGTATITIVDPLEQLHPANTGSPFNSGGNTITSYRCCQIAAWWNPATLSVAGNLLNAGNPIPAAATGAAYTYDPSFEAWFLRQTTSGATFASSGTHPDGSHAVWQATVSAAASYVAYYPRTQVGVPYTLTVDIWAAVGLVVRLAWTGSTPVTASITGTGAYQSTHIVFTPTAADTAAFVTVSAPSAGSYPQSFWVSNWILQGTVPGYLSTGSPTMVYTTSAAHTGEYCLGLVYAASSNTVTLPLPTAPGFQYTCSAYVDATGSGSVVTQTIGAASVATTVINSFQRLSLTFTATDAVTQVTWTAAGTFPLTALIDDIQLEFSGSASAFTTTGPTMYPLYTGYIEQFPLQWDMQGTRGIRPLTCVDALSVLSRTEITQSYQTTILADGAAVYIPLSDAAIPQAVQLPLGGQPMQGYSNLGTNGSVNFQGDTFLDGSAAVSLTQQNATPVVTGDPNYITWLGTHNGLLAMNPQSFCLELWAKVVSGTLAMGAAAVQPGENTNGEALGPTDFVGWTTNAGKLILTFSDPSGAALAASINNGGSYTGFPDGQWHHFAVRFLTGAVVNSFVDGVGGLGFLPTGTLSQSIGLNNIFVDVTTYFGDPVSTVSLANIAVYPMALSGATIANHYNVGSGYYGEVSGARVARLVSQYWGGASSVAAGKRQLSPDNASGGNDYNSRFLLDVLQEIQETERGLVYASAAGVLVFEDSTTRYTASPVSKWVFGENPPGASPVEYPYNTLEEGFDPTFTFSQTNLTRPGNPDFQPLPTPLPLNPPYGQRVLSQEVEVNTDFDLFQASAFYLKRYGSPQLRIVTLELNPAGNPALWAVVLSLEISQRVTVKRRTTAGFATSSDYYIEQIGHSIDIESGVWTVQLQCSPAFNPSAWILGDSTYGVLGTTTVPVY